MRYLLSFLMIVSMWCSHAQVPLTRDVWLNEANTALRVNSILIDSGQCMWLGTDNGLFTYNGQEAVAVSDSIREPVTALALYNGSILYGTEKGMVYSYQAGQITKVLTAQASISTITVLPYGLMVGTLGDGGYYVSGQNSYHFSKQDVLPDDYIYRIIPAPSGVFMATDLGVFNVRLRQDGRIVCEAVDFPADITRVVAAAQKPGGVWVGFQEKGVGYFTQQDTAFVPTRLAPANEQWIWGQVNDICPFSATAAWVVTEDGLLIKATLQDKRLQFEVVLSTGRKINRLLPDRSGNLWLGTHDCLVQATADYLGIIKLPDHYSLNKVTALTVDTGGHIWYTQDQELYMYHQTDRTARLVLRAPSIITCLYNDASNRLWIGTSGHGLLSRHAGGTVKSYKDVPAIAGSHILSLAGNGAAVWLSGLNGIAALTVSEDGDITAVKQHQKREGIGSDYVYRIFIDSKKRTWFATDGAGISMTDGHKYYHWGEQEGFGSKVVYAITEDNAGRIWAGTLEQGVYVYDEHRWQQYTRLNGLQDPTITSLAADGSGHVLLVTAKGIDIWYPGSLAFRHLNKRSGFGLDSNLSDVLNLAAISPNQDIYLPAPQGLLVFKGTAADIRPAVNITGVSLFLKELHPRPQHFSHDENYLGFRFQGVNFTHADPLYYRYRLEGLSREWTLTTDDMISFPRLQPGHYRFTVQASLSRSFDNPVAAGYSLEIARPFWKQWWFLLSVICAGGFILYWLVQRRLLSLKRVALLKEERMAFEYEYLKSQVNPHFLFNSLNTLVTLIEENPESAMNYTGHLSDLYRETLSAHEDDLVLLSHEWEILDKYCYIQQTRFGEALQVISSVPDTIKNTRRVIPLALQLLVENAIKHNVVSQADPLVVFIDIAGDYLTVRNRIHLKITPEKSSGIGLQNIIKRYALVTDEKVKVNMSDHEFIVALPLL
jgi:ligand-binding sensor domain-containing protein